MLTLLATVASNANNALEKNMKELISMQTSDEDRASIEGWAHSSLLKARGLESDLALKQGRTLAPRAPLATPVANKSFSQRFAQKVKDGWRALRGIKEK